MESEGEKISWQAYEYQHTEKSADWFWALGIIAASIAGTSILFGNTLFAIFIILGALTIGMLSARRPVLMNVELGPKGLKVGRTFYPFSSIESFWIDDFENDKKLIIKTDSITIPHLSILANDVDMEALKNYLLKFLPEEEYMEPLSHKIMERLGF